MYFSNFIKSKEETVSNILRWFNECSFSQLAINDANLGQGDQQLNINRNTFFLMSALLHTLQNSWNLLLYLCTWCFSLPQYAPTCPSCSFLTSPEERITCLAQVGLVILGMHDWSRIESWAGCGGTEEIQTKKKRARRLSRRGFQHFWLCSTLAKVKMQSIKYLTQGVSKKVRIIFRLMV